MRHQNHSQEHEGLYRYTAEHGTLSQKAGNAVIQENDFPFAHNIDQALDGRHHGQGCNEGLDLHPGDDKAIDQANQGAAQDKQEAKRQIAAAAADLVKDGDFIFINVGTTCLYVCEALKSKRNITVVTNSIPILNSLLNTPSITVIFLGGIVNSDMQITTGDDVVDQLAKYTADKLFLGMDGVDAEMGATTYNHIEDAIIRQMIQHAKEKILVVDDSKIGKVTFARVAHLSDFDAIITNQNEEKAQEMEKIAAMGVRVIYA